MKNKIFYIIINKLYKLTAQKYISYIQDEILAQEWFKIGCKSKEIKVRYLSNNFSDDYDINIYATIKDSNIVFINKLLIVKFDFENFDDKNKIKLLNINLINQTIFNILNLLLYLQNKFIKKNCFHDLVFCNRGDFIKLYQDKYSGYIDSSILSKVLKDRYILVNQFKFGFLALLPTISFLKSIYIKKLIFENSSLNDKQLAVNLNSKYGLKMESRGVCRIRNKYLIPPVSKRKETNYYNERLYSKIFTLTFDNIYNLGNQKGVYELSSKDEVNYPLSKLKIVYIGSSRCIRIRLMKYFNNYAHTKSLKDFIANNDIYFRYIQTSNYKEYEKIFLDEFRNMSG